MEKKHQKAEKVEPLSFCRVKIHHILAALSCALDPKGLDTPSTLTGVHLKQVAQPAFVLDISDQWEQKLASIACYQSQFVVGRPKETPTFLDRLRDEAAFWGKSIGTQVEAQFTDHGGHLRRRVTDGIETENFRSQEPGHEYIE